MTTLRTPRLELIAATLEHVEAELRGQSELAKLLGARVPPDWPPGEWDRPAQEFFRELLARHGPRMEGWLSWYAVTLTPAGERDTLVANGGFSGPPMDGVAEIGYSVVPAARRVGYATEIVKALVAHAFEDPGVREILAHTSDENVASTRVLLRCGFNRVGAGPEPGSIKYRRAAAPRLAAAE